MTDLRAALAEVRAIDPSLQARFDAAFERAVAWRYADGFSAPHRPEPWFEARDRRFGGWRDGLAAEHGDALRVGFDAEGRPVVCDRVRGGESDMVFEAWEHGDGRSLLVERHDRVSLLLGPLDRIEAVVSATPGGEVEIERFTWEGDVAVRGDKGRASDTGWPSSTAWHAEVDDEGGLARLVHGYLPSEHGDDDRLTAEELEDAVLAALDAAASIEPSKVVWDARYDRREPHLRPTEELVAVLTDGLARGVELAVRDAAVDEPFVVDLRPGGSNEDGRGLPGFLRVGSRAFRDEMVQFGSGDFDALTVLWKGEEEGTVAKRLVREFCDDDTLRACREVNTALDVGRDFDEPDRRRAADALETVERALAARLNRDVAWPGVADPFLVLVRLSPYGGDDWREIATQAIGAAAVERFAASLRHQGEARSAGTVDLDAVRADRGALEAWLRDRGLSEQARHLAHEVAEVGLRLVEAHGPARSRLGGTGLLPPGEPWPAGEDDRPLRFVAALDLAELGDDRLPPAGWLLFFVDIEGDDEDPEDAGFWGEPTPNEPGEAARVLHVPPGTEPVEAGGPTLRRQRPVRVRPELTLPDDYDIGSRFGLSAARGEALSEIASRLRYGDEGFGSTEDHWVLGHATGVQGHQVEPGTALLLHLGWDEELGFMFQDGGAVQFRIPLDALAVGDWSQVCTEGDSG